MYTLTKSSSGVVTYINLSREEAISKIDLGKNTYHFQKDYKTTPRPNTYKYDRGSSDFILLEWDKIKEIRNELLADSDWRTTSDYPGSDQQEWLDYRKDLRELPQKYRIVEDIVFPKEPNV